MTQLSHSVMKQSGCFKNYSSFTVEAGYVSELSHEKETWPSENVSEL
jgi:hypothetical protein